MSVATWWVEQRTPTLDTVSHYATMMSDTLTAIVVTVVAVVALRLWLGRWTESLILVAAIGGELLYFLILTTAVGRPRPDVPRLDEAPPTSSFPSGHTGAAVALYVCLAVIIWTRVAQRALAVPVAVVLCVIPVAVGVSRMYRGMHYATDVVSGALGGLIWLLVVLAVLWPQGEAEAVIHKAPTTARPLRAEGSATPGGASVRVPDRRRPVVRGRPSSGGRRVRDVEVDLAAVGRGHGEQDLGGLGVRGAVARQVVPPSRPGRPGTRP